MHWKRNLFKVPSGKTGKMFTNKLAHLFQAYADQSVIESIALTAAMVMPALLLQKPHNKSNTKEHVRLVKFSVVECILLDGELEWVDCSESTST